MGLRSLLLSSAIVLAIGSIVANAIIVRNAIEETEHSVFALTSAGEQRVLISSIGGRALKSITIGDPGELIAIRDETRVQLDDLRTLLASLYGHGKLYSQIPSQIRVELNDHYHESMEWQYLEFIAAVEAWDARLSSHLWNQYRLGQPTEPGDFDPDFPPFGAFVAENDGELLAVFAVIERSMISGVMAEINISLGIIEEGIAASIDSVESLRLQMNAFIFLAVAYLGVALYLTLYRPTRQMATQLGDLNRGLDLQVVERTKQLNRERAELQAVLGSALDGIISIDPDSNIEVFNPAAQEMFGYEKEEILGKNVSLLMPERYRSLHANAVDHYLETGERRVLDRRAEVEGLRRDGTAFPIELSVSEVKLNEKSAFTAVMRDITDRKKFEAGLKEAVRQAVAASKAKSEFLATMSHELRTPLNAIIGFSELMQARVMGDVNDKQGESLETITRSGKHLLNLINDILDLSRVESGYFEINRDEVKIDELVEESVESLGSLSSAKQIEVSVSFEVSDELFVGDRQKLKQIIVNLVGNAIKFTPDNGSVKVESRTLTEGKLINSQTSILQIAVLDNAQGFDPNEQERLFDTFYQGDSSYSRDQQGTGLGLPLSRRLARLLKGDVAIFSAGPGEGSRAYIEIPYGKNATSEAA